MTEREFGEAYVRLLPDLRRYVIRTIGNAADVDDIVQEAFLRMLRVDFQDWNDERWRRYLFRTASNLIIDRWRRRRFEHGGGAMPEPASPTPHPEDAAAVAKIFSELKPRERALLWLAYVEGESHEEIASALGLGRRGVRALRRDAGYDGAFAMTTLIARTIPAPSSASSRARIKPCDRSTSRPHAASFAVTCNTPSRRATVVPRSMAGPTAERHAKATL